MLHLIPTKEQQEAVNLATSGHNICIFGRAGVGKSTVVEEIKKILTAKGETCQIVCSSGISCDTYHGMAKTVHSQYGLQTAQLPAHMVIERSLGRKNVVDQIKATSVLIWDEISMSSRRVFHLVNVLHHMLSTNNHPFGGIQVILVGDFWQVKPIPNPFDAGKSIYGSALVNTVFPHRFELKKVMRQGESEQRLKEALDLLRVGQCNDQIEDYLRSLSRECVSTTTTSHPVHIYFKKLPVVVHNLNVLADFPGQLITYESNDTGCAQYLENTVSKILTVKPGCKVMLLYNINDHLKNGYRGQFIGNDPDCDDQLIVRFPEVGNVSIGRRTWYRYDNNGRVQASRTQFPLAPCYAITVHKAQSLTLDGVVVHCAQEFVSGQTYVAVSRVRQEATLQVIGFQRKFLLPPPTELASFVTNQSGNPDAGLFCCKNADLDESFFKIAAHEREIMDEEDDCSLRDVNDDDGVANAKKYFESNLGNPVNLEDVLLCMSDFNDELSLPPSDFNMAIFLAKIINGTQEDSYSKSIKSAANYGADNLELFELLARILWCRIAVLFKDYLCENLEEVHMTNKDFNCATAKLHQVFLTQEYRSDIISAFNVRKWVEIDDGQRSLGAHLLFHLYQMYAAEVGKRVRKQEMEPVRFEVQEMGSDGLGKIRYIGGWAIKKSLDKSRRYVINNKLSQSSHVRSKVSSEMKKIELLENNIIIPHEILQASTTSPETLNVIESRQYRERGLLYISDGAYKFFLTLEQERVNQINVQKLSSLRNNMVDNAITEVENNQFLERAFTELFDLVDTDVNKGLVVAIFKEVIQRYLKMGAGQFLQDFRRDFHVKKSLAHRKAVMERKEKAREKQMKVNLPELEQDRSDGKRVSHTRLLALMNEVKENGISRLYKKKEMQHLCSAYGVRYLSKWNKAKLASELVLAVPRYAAIPCHQVTSTYAVDTVGEDHPTRIPILRIRRL